VDPPIFMTDRGHCNEVSDQKQISSSLRRTFMNLAEN